ncbi:hypothetical protein FACS189444_3070 [Spirochaetia bacterium]|nr:hypothetical protein FACS189444_3070 [Spirochaetia bacterium]
MNDFEYYIASGWMKNQLGLEGDEMVVYAIIYGYSQDGMSKYQGTAQRIADWIGKEKRTVYKILKSLCGKGLIERHEKRINDVPLNDYSVVIEKVPGSAKRVPLVQESYGGSAKNVLPPGAKNVLPSTNNAHLKDSISTEDTRQDKDNPDLSGYFISLWQSEPTVVNCMARLKSPNDWAEYWRLCQGTREDIKRSWDNFIAGVKSGAIERRFVPANPDTFILGDGLNRYRDPPQKKAGPKIGKDSVDDVSQFFKEGGDADT